MPAGTSSVNASASACASPSASPSASNLRLVWAWPHGSVPRWLAQCLARLQSVDGLQASLGTPPAATASSGAVTLLLDPAQPCPGRCWLLTDGSGLPLDPLHPLLAGITGGHGIDLALWQRSAAAQDWQLLRRLHVAATPRYSRALRDLPQAAARLLHQAAIAVQLPDAAPDAIASTALRPAARAARTSLWRRVAQRLRGEWLADRLRQRARWLTEAWQIGIIDQPLGSWALGTSMPPVRWLPAPSSQGYWADPMADGTSSEHLLCEYFDAEQGRGRIERLAVDATGVTRRQTLPLGEGQHVSFPLVLNLGGRRVGLAETAALGRCQLHEVGDDGSWRPVATLLDGVAAADPALFEWEGRCWLAYTDIALGAMDNLCLLHAPALEGPWEPHANNPVKVDITGARMAGGLFWHQGALYRPAQNCLQTYGASVLVHRVLRCTPTAYEEEAVRELRPDPHGPCPDGMHTLSAWGQRSLVDGKRHVFSPRSLWLKLTRRWHKPAGAADKLPSVELR